MRLAHVYIFCLLAAAEVSLAQSPDTVYTIGEITVTATREVTPQSRAPQRVSVFDSEAIRASAARNLADLLEARTGFFVRRYGAGLATASMRGSGASQTALLIDGLRLSDPQLGQFDLSLLPSYLMRSVEVVHGPTSALYGTDGIAGAVNLRRIRPEDGHLIVLTEFGAYGERRMSGGASLEGGRWSGLVAAEYGHTDGDFPYLNEALFPSRIVRRRNADRDKRSLYGTAEWDAGGHRVQASLLYADAQQGLPGGAGGTPVGERQWDEHLRVWMQDRMTLVGSRLDLQGFIHRGALRYSNPQLELDETSRVLTSGIEGVIRYPTGPAGTLIFGTSGGLATADHPSLANLAREYHGAVFASASQRAGRFLLYPAVRVDAYAPSRGEVEVAASPRLGLNAPVLRSIPIYAKANAGTAFRMPTFNDRFWTPGGNPDLRPERSRSAEIGLYLDHHPLSLELTAFQSRTIDQIVWLNVEGGIWSPENLSETAAGGLEASARWAPRAPLTSGVFYSFTRAVDRSDPSSRSYGRQLRYVPAHQIKAYATADLGLLHASIHGRYVGRRYVTSDESEALPPVVTLEALAGASHPIGPFEARLSLVVENVLNARYALIQNYPMPPRHARLQLLLESRSN